MRKFWYALVAAALIGVLVCGLGACKKKEEEQKKEDVIDQPVKAEGIELNWQEVLLVKGTSVTLAHTVSPEGATGTATYTSTDTAVATVSAQGVVSGLKAGVTTVTAKIDDSHYAECRVIVGDVIVKASEAQIPNEQGETGAEGGQNAENGNAQSGEGTQNGETNGETGGTNTGDETDTGTGGSDNPLGGGETGTDTGDGGGNSGEADGTDTGDGQGTGGDTTSQDGATNPTNGGETDGQTTENGTQNGGTSEGNGDQSSTNGQSGTSAGSNGTESNGETESMPVRRTVSGGVKGETLFESVQAAVGKAKANDVVVVDKGDYKEAVTIGKSLTVMGVGNPKVQKVTVETGNLVKLQNISVVTDEYPSAGEAAVLVKTSAGVEIRNCVITSKATGELEGGYGVLVEKQARGVTMVGNSIGNFRYGVYVCPTDQSVTITDNRLSNMAVGIGLDVRQENAETNYPTLGKIADNEYNEVTKHTQFLHYGENYEGDFDFGDNEEENASQGNSNTGGGGLME